MLKIAITGNIASGKTQAEKFLLSRGYKVIDTDKINHFILASDFNVISEIKETFKDDDIFDENMQISREKLGKIVFLNKDKKDSLEAILHERIFQKVNEFYTLNQKEPFVFVLIPLLFETNKEKDFDKIIFISADEDIRLERLIKRNGYTKNYAMIRIKAQQKEQEKINKSDYIVYNNSDFINFNKQLNDILNKLEIIV